MVEGWTSTGGILASGVRSTRWLNETVPLGDWNQRWKRGLVW